MGIMENTKQVSVKNCIKYIVFAGVIYAVLKVVPTTQLSNIEISVLICVILLGIFSLDCLTTSNKKKKEDMTNTNMFDLDLDVDLDFNKRITETTSDVKSNKSSESPVSSVKGVNMEEVRQELRKRNTKLSETSTEEKPVKSKKESKKVESDSEKQPKKRTKDERKESTKASKKESSKESKKESSKESKKESSKES